MHAHDLAHIVGIAASQDPRHGNALRFREREDAPVAGHQVVVIERQRRVGIFKVGVGARLVEQQIRFSLGDPRQRRVHDFKKHRAFAARREREGGVILAVRMVTLRNIAEAIVVPKVIAVERERGKVRA